MVTSNDSMLSKQNSSEKERETPEAGEEAEEKIQRPKTSKSSKPNNNEDAEEPSQAVLAQPKLQQKRKSLMQREISEINQKKRRIEEYKHEIEQAKRLKEHYFGTSNKKELESYEGNINEQKSKISFKCPDLLDNNLSLPLVQIEERIKKKLTKNLKEEPIATALKLLFTFNFNKKKLQICVETLSKIVENILAHPNEEKYRKIRCENEQIKEKLLSCKNCDLVLTTLGFKLSEEMYLFDHEDDLNYAKMYEFKESLNNVQPIKLVLDRNILLIKSLLKANANRFNLDDNFYNLSIDELKREQKLCKESIEKFGLLRTKAMRQRDELIEMRMYCFCLIRVKFTDSIYLQLIFNSNETLQELYLNVQSCLRNKNCNFELSNFIFKPQKQNVSQTFAEAGLAPAAVLHFRFKSQPIPITLSIFEKHLVNTIRYSFP